MPTPFWRSASASQRREIVPLVRAAPDDALQRTAEPGGVGRKILLGDHEGRLDDAPVGAAVADDNSIAAAVMNDCASGAAIMDYDSIRPTQTPA